MYDLTPEQNLWSAVISLGLRDALTLKPNTFGSRKYIARKFFEERGPTFVKRCELACLDPDWVYRIFLKLREENDEDVRNKCGRRKVKINQRPKKKLSG